MSANAWVFHTTAPTPFDWRVALTIRYTGPGWEDDNDPPTTALSEIVEHLDVWWSQPYSLSLARDWTDAWKKTEAWVAENEKEIIRGIADSPLNPKWYWDT